MGKHKREGKGEKADRVNIPNNFSYKKNHTWHLWQNILTIVFLQTTYIIQQLSLVCFPFSLSCSNSCFRNSLSKAEDTITIVQLPSHASSPILLNKTGVVWKFKTTSNFCYRYYWWYLIYFSLNHFLAAQSWGTVLIKRAFLVCFCQFQPLSLTWVFSEKKLEERLHKKLR